MDGQRRVILFCVLALATVVSAQQWHTTIDVLHHPAKVLPDAYADLLIVNYSVAQPAEYGHVVLQNGQSAGSVAVDLGMAAERMLFALSEVLDYQSTLASVALLPVSQNSSESIYGSTLPSAQEAAQWMADYTSNEVLSLDKLILYDKTDCYLTMSDDYYAYLEVYLMSRWTAQTIEGNKQQYVFADTLYWEGKGDVPSEAIAQLPDRQTALLDFAAYAGERFGQQFLSAWQQEDRYFYEDNKRLLRSGFQQLSLRRWQQAQQEWEKVYNATDNRLTRAYAAADIAVACELQDDFEAAISWAKKAQTHFLQSKGAEAAQQTLNVAFYIQQLRRRQRL